LLDSAGRLIGINTMILSPSGTSAGIGFAVPVDTVNAVVPQLIAHGRRVRPGLGVFIATDHVMRQLGRTGVLVLRVNAGSSAETAGLRGTRRDPAGALILGDTIVEVDGRPVRTRADLLSALGEHKVGDTVNLVVRRGDQQVAMDVALQAID